MSIGNQVVTIIGRTEVNNDGDITDTGVRVDVPGCYVQPESGTETYTTGRTVTRSFRVYGPEELGSAQAVDVLEIDGWLIGQAGRARVQVEGLPAVWPNVRGEIDHVEVSVTYRSG